MGFQKLKSKKIAYSNYKNVGDAKFKSILITATSNVDLGMYKSTIFNKKEEEVRSC